MFEKQRMKFNLTCAFSMTRVMLDFSDSLKPEKSTSDKVGIRVKSLAIFCFATTQPS